MKDYTKLKEAVRAQLNFWVGESARKLQVEVSNGVVTLRGCLPNYAEKMGCLETVRRVDGVKEVADELVVELPKSRQRKDAEIASAAADAIHWITTVPLDSIKITVQAGRLLLEGMVEDAQQKKVVELVVRHLPGITGIANLITTKRELRHPDVSLAPRMDDFPEFPGCSDAAPSYVEKIHTRAETVTPLLKGILDFQANATIKN